MDCVEADITTTLAVSFIFVKEIRLYSFFITKSELRFNFLNFFKVLRLETKVLRAFRFTAFICNRKKISYFVPRNQLQNVFFLPVICAQAIFMLQFAFPFLKDLSKSGHSVFGFVKQCQSRCRPLRAKPQISPYVVTSGQLGNTFGVILI